MPFGNQMVVTELPGRQILAALANGFSRAGTGAGWFPRIAGMHVVGDPTAPPMARLSRASVAGKPLDPDRIYRLATNDYTLSRGDGSGALGGGRVVVDKGNGRRMANDVIAYIRAIKTVKIHPDGRISKLGD
ncbi:hypothetical protein GCM10008024_22420 [Allgaiera indica]|uniref:5'-Nucleotidase C-terminal domain-containing protein n=1 Tax=Allgaiera indica TaxID=765699 RepID=A0AAN4USQ4_9RHOB|nr:hypothetical protein GCM10008024_22420 [Allgaiera indica]